MKHERYHQPGYLRLYGPFASGGEAQRWEESANLPDYTVALRVCAPDELEEQLDDLRRNGQLTPDGQQLP